MGRGLLILASGLVLIVGIIQKSVSERLDALPERTTNYHQEMDARNIANSLMEYGIRELDKDQDWQQGFSSNDFLGAEANLQVFTYEDYTNNNPDIPSDNNIQNWDPYSVLLVSTAKTRRTKAVTQVGISKDSFSKYTYFTDYEPSNIYFFDDDELNGPVHTNGKLHIADSPTFNGFVSSPNDWVGHPSYDNDPQFNAGSNFDSKEKEMPGPDKLDRLRAKSQNGGLTFNQDIYVEFKANGTVDVRKRGGNGNWGSPVQYNLSNYNGVISSSKKVYTQGTLKGQVTLHSAEEVEIMGDLTYATNDEKNGQSGDLLGIVSEGDVIVDYKAHKANGNKDLEIHASIMALDESFKVEAYSYGDPRGTLKLYGGLQQKVRGAVGTFGGGQVQSGYSKDYSYDKRLGNIMPPYYPRESIFSITYWKEKPVQYLQP